MKKVFSSIIVLCLLFSLVSCLDKSPDTDKTNNSVNFVDSTPIDLGGNNDTFGTDLEDSGIFDGYFETESDIKISLVSTYLSISSHNYTIQSAYTYWSNVRLCAVRCQKE